MEQLKNMKQQLTSLVQGQLAHTDCVDTKELGEAVDMIKDLAEAIYYCTITEAMEGKDKENSNNKEVYYYTMPIDYRYPDYRDEDIYYYGGNGGSRCGSSSYAYNGNMTGTNGARVARSGRRMYTEDSMNMMRDSREGRSPMSRKMYMESKEMHQDSAVQMKELEKYMQELSKDIMEMIEEATPEEKQVLQQKIATLAQKIK